MSRRRKRCTTRTTQFLRKGDGKMPFIIGLAGSVAVGKSTTARVLQALLARWPSHPRVELVPTDGFLFPNDVLEARGLMNRKGFPESYDLTKILNFLADVKSGKEKVEAPVYSHLIYDVLPDQKLSIERPDIVIVEGLNVLQPAKLPKDGEAIPFVSDFFDFSIYIDAADELVESWYVERFLRLRQTAFRDPASYFHRYATLSEEEAVATGLSIWRTINLVNLQREYPADAAARRSHPAQRRGSCGGDGGAQEALDQQPAISAAPGRAAASRARYSAEAWCGWRRRRPRRSRVGADCIGSSAALGTEEMYS